MAAEPIAFGYVTAKTVKLEIIRVADDFSLDWNDGVFKNSGWTTKQKTLAEGTGTRLGRYTDAGPDPAAWSDGTYDFIVTETTIANAVLSLSSIGVQAGRFIAGAGIPRSVWTFDVTGVDENNYAGARAATKIMNLFRRFLVKVTQTATQQKIYKNDGSTVLATLPVSNDGTTQVVGPGA
jgi:hypothetical protein